MQTVDNGDELHLAGRVQGAFQRHETAGAVAFEHGELELDGCGPAAGRLKHTHGEELRAFGVDAVPPVLEHAPMRVNAHA